MQNPMQKDADRFYQTKFNSPYVRILGSGAEGKGETPPLPRRKTENSPEELEDTMDKPKTQVFKVRAPILAPAEARLFAYREVDKFYPVRLQ